MSSHPVHLHVATPERMSRAHLVIRLAFLTSLGALGWSSLYWVAYLALPALAAAFISQRGAEGFLRDDAPRIERALRWLAARGS
jgi:hypothetical protein